jgi:hypothetical protein
MAAVSGVVRTDFDAVPRVLHKSNEAGGGKLRVMHDTYEANALAAASTIKMGTPLPIGARIIDVVVDFDDLGSTNGTIAAGDAGSSNRYLSAFATGSAGHAGMAGANGQIDGRGYVITGVNDTDILLTTAGNSLTGTIKCTVLFAVD